MADTIEPGVETTSPVASASAGEPNGSEAVTNTGAPSEQNIPFERFQEVNNSLKEERAAREQLAQQVESLNSRFAPQAPVDDIDPEVERVLEQFAKKNGFVSKAQLDELTQQNATLIQAREDVADLQKQFSDYDHSKVVAYAKENNMSINSKANLRAAYRDMNFDSINDATKKAAIAEFQQSGRTTATGGSTATQAPAPQNNTPKGRIAAARAKLGV